MSPPAVAETLPSDEIDQIVESFQFSPEKNTQLKKYLPRLRRMKYDPEYLSCFTGRPTYNLRAMVEDKIACWAKYSDSP